LGAGHEEDLDLEGSGFEFRYYGMSAEDCYRLMLADCGLGSEDALFGPGDRVRGYRSQRMVRGFDDFFDLPGD
jgi:hypothetical protein